MRSFLKLASVLSSICMVAVAAPSSQVQSSTAAQRPIYAIAHMVLDTQGMKDALSNGANALEIDLTAWKNWWADHDGTETSAGDTARTLFENVAKERNAGQNIPFVWLDIKNPDYCSTEDANCGIKGLRDLSRELLEPAGVRVLYGFFHTETSSAYQFIADSLNDNEAVVLSGEAGEVADMYDGVSFPVNQRIMDYGWTELEHEFGDCQEDGYYTCTELRQAADLRDQGIFGRVFGWTSTVNQGSLVGKLMGDAGVDGIIYGFHTTRYYDHPDIRAPADDITGWVSDHFDTHRMATNSDVPW